MTKHPRHRRTRERPHGAEQLLYEIGPPAYMTPDVVARFDSVRLEQQAPDRVRVTGARGEPAPAKLKVSISYHAGWRAFGRLVVSGPQALAKANKVAEAFWEAAGGRAAYDQALHQFIGWNGCHAPLATCEPGEVMVQFAVRDSGRAQDQLAICAAARPARAGNGSGNHVHRRSGPAASLGGRGVLARARLARGRRAEGGRRR